MSNRKIERIEKIPNPEHPCSDDVCTYGEWDNFKTTFVCQKRASKRLVFDDGTFMFLCDQHVAIVANYIKQGGSKTTGVVDKQEKMICRMQYGGPGGI